MRVNVVDGDRDEKEDDSSLNTTRIPNPFGVTLDAPNARTVGESMLPYAFLPAST